MGVAIEDVKLWAIGGGIGHAVAYTKFGYTGTACDIFSNMQTTSERPRRVCSKCRERLKVAFPVSSSIPETKP